MVDEQQLVKSTLNGSFFYIYFHNSFSHMKILRDLFFLATEMETGAFGSRERVIVAWEKYIYRIVCGDQWWQHTL